MDVAVKAIFNKINPIMGTSNAIDTTKTSAAFDAMDADKSGFIELSEFTTYFGADAEPAFVPMGGANGGKILKAGWTSFFTAVADSAGKIDTDRLKNALEANQAAISGTVKGGRRRRTSKKSKSSKKMRGGRRNRKTRKH